MPKRKYAGYLPKDFDNYDCLKLSLGIYFILLFILRGYLVWLMSVTNMRDHIGFVLWVYPEPPLFYLSLVSGMFGLFIVLLLSLRRPDAVNWVVVLWRKCHLLLIVALIFDLAVDVFGFFYWQLQSLLWLSIQSVIVFSSIAFILLSKRFAINLAEFPQAMAK